ncbi:MAG: DUF2087 domain-containing protein [Candidatus Cloacimonetes bacterium]|nr:DUF2087 domain-containing protein [Candidatus Cloacimonadota bacterium]
MIKDKYEIDEKARGKVLKAYFNKDSGRLQTLPNKEKKKVIIFQKIAENFESARKYSEKEVNEIIKSFYDDYFIIRRSLIDYGFMNRTQDCREYWVND